MGIVDIRNWVTKRLGNEFNHPTEADRYNHTYEELDAWAKDNYLTGDKVEGGIIENPLWRKKRMCDCCDKSRVCITTWHEDSHHAGLSMYVCFNCSKDLLGFSRPTFNKYVDRVEAWEPVGHRI